MHDPRVRWALPSSAPATGTEPAAQLPGLPAVPAGLAVCVEEERARRVLGSYSTIQTATRLADVLRRGQRSAASPLPHRRTRHDVAMAAIEAGKHVLVEKPLGATYAEGREMVRAAKERGVVLMCDPPTATRRQS